MCLVLLATASSAHGQSGCAEDGAYRVGLTAGLGAGFGAAGALGVSAIATAADPNDDYSFAVGALAGIGVTSGLALIYAFADGASGCPMVRDAGGIAWSVPLVLGVVGSLLPLAVWGASTKDESGDAASSQALSTTAGFPAARTVSLSIAF